jgi:Acetyltransferase (GNAT) family
MKYKLIDYDSFVDEQLEAIGYRIMPITEEVMSERIDEFMSFVNEIRTEYSALYGWETESREYFLNPMNQKFKYSFAIIDKNNEICFVNFSSVYSKVIHYHFAYARKDTRGLNLAKFHLIKLCRLCLENGYTKLEAYWPKNNNSSIILYLKMGWQIELLRNNRDLFMIADIKYVMNRTYELLISEK